VGEAVTPIAGSGRNRYFATVDPSLPNNAHAYQLRLVGRDKDVLELGCAAGHMTRALKEQGCRVVAIDVDADAVRFAGEFADRALVEDIGADPPLTSLDERFDVVLAGDVLEHLPDPGRLLDRCRTLLRPDGYLVLSVPNVAHVDLRLALLQGYWDYRDWGLLDRTHLRLFTRRSLDRLLRDSGYVPVELFRVVRPVGTTEIEVDMHRVSPDVLDIALADPEAETYQFVMRAVVDTRDFLGGGESQLELAERVDLEIARRRRVESELDAALSELHETQASLHASRRAVRAMRATRTFRYTAAPRRTYSRLRRLLGR
jgi:SAM-dependent methyltransferase